MATRISPVGSTVVDHLAERRSKSERVRTLKTHLEPFEELARFVIMRRAKLDLTQQELADRMASTKSVISRIESGQHRTSTATLRRLAQALGGHAVIGFQFDGEPAELLVRL